VYRERSSWAKLAELCVLDGKARGDVARLREAAVIHRTELGDARAAAQVLKIAREARPDDRSLLTELVGMLSDAGDHAAAAEELKAAIEAMQDGDPARPSLLAQRAHIRSTLGDEEGALADMETAYAADHATYARDLAAQLERSCGAAAREGDAARERALRLRLVELLVGLGDLEGARVLLADLIRQDPKDRDALRALAAIEESAERWDVASATYRRLVALEEGDAVVETALRLADACERASRVGDARGGLERARMVAPANEALRQRLERLYEQTGAWRELADMFLADAKATGDVAGRFAHLMRAGAVLLEHAGDNEGAIAALKEAHALRPNEHACITQLGDALIAAGRTAEATEVLNAAVALHKGRRSRELASLYHRLARVAHAEGNPSAELGWLTQALDMDSQNGAVAAEVATAAMDAGQLDLANRALRNITMLKNPGPMPKALAYQYMGEIARKQGDTKRAIMLLKRAVQEDPNLTGAKALLDHVLSES
jgi:tetratricopeptide (TPR) repeat protein